MNAKIKHVASEFFATRRGKALCGVLIGGSLAALWSGIGRGSRPAVKPDIVVAINSVPAVAPEDRPAVIPKPPAAPLPPTAPEPPKPTPEERWKVILPALEKAREESASAIEAQIAKIDEAFGEMRSKIPDFADTVLSDEAKLQATGVAMDGMINAIGELFGEKPGLRGDGLRNFVERSFKQQVLDPDQLRPVIEGVASGWSSADQAIEARMLVSLDADLDETGLGSSRSLTTVNPQLLGGEPLNALITQTIDTVGEELALQLAKFLASWFIGDAISAQITDEEDAWLKRMGIEIAVGKAVDALLDEAVVQAGHNPRAQVAAKVGLLLDKMRSQLVEGEPNEIQTYNTFKQCSTRHDADDVRAACSKAAQAIRTNGNIGIRLRLLEELDERFRARKASLSRLIFGVDVPPNEAKTVRDISGSELYLLDSAKQYINLYGSSSFWRG